MSEIHILSLGAGVQSSTMALMAACGELKPMPVAAIFADTQAEPMGVYTWLDWLEKQLPFPVIRATAGDLGADSTRLRTSKKSGNTYLKHTPPVFTMHDGKRGMMMRQCTRDYKVKVIQRAARAVLKEHGAKRCKMWIGISTDEASRMKPSQNAKFENIWPLIDAGISRRECLDWMAESAHPQPPRSACTFCPYHSDKEWTRLRDEEPEAFAHAVAYEKRLSVAAKASTALRIDEAFLHKSCVPLEQVQFQETIVTIDMFGNECEGMCGV